MLTIIRQVALTTALLAWAGFAFATPLTLCYENEDVYPWLLKDGKGLRIIMLEMVAAKAKIDLKMESMPWKRCLVELERGNVNGAIGASFKEDRAQYAVYPMAGGKLDAARRQHSDTYSLYRLKGDKLDWDGTRFSNLTGQIGVQSGYSVVGDLKKLGIQADDAAKTSEANMLKLVAGRVQGVAALTLEADQLIRSHSAFTRKVEKIKTPLVDKPYFVIFGKAYYAANQKTVEDFWKTVESVRNSREYQTRQTNWLKSNFRSETSQ